MTKFLATLGVALMLGVTSASASTAARVNGMVITVDEANKALNVLTKGKMTWDKLPKDGKTQLIQMIAPSKLVAKAAKKDLNAKEKEAALANFWMQKRMSKISISDKMAKKAYDKMKKAAKATKSKKKIPAFDTVKRSIKLQLAQEEVVSALMKKANIKLK